MKRINHNKIIMNYLNELICQEQTYERFISKLEEKDLIIKEDDNLFLVSYPNNNEEGVSDPLVNSCKGVIFQKSPLKIVCYTFSKTQDCDINDETTLQSLDFKSFRTEELIDGSFMKLYYVDGNWNVSTNRCINPKKANWNNYKTFYDMWEEARIESNIDYNTLDTSCVYGFVLCHPQNRIVSKYQSPHLVYISKFNMKEKHELPINVTDLTEPNEQNETNETNEPQDILKHNIISKQFEFNSLAEMVDSIKEMPFWCRGISIISKERNDQGEYDRYIIENPEWIKIKNIRGEKRSMIERYIELSRTDIETFNLFNKYFPEFSWIDVKMEQLSQMVLWLYESFYINKTTSFINPKYWELINELHNLYIFTSEPISIHVVRNHLNTYPIKELCILLRGRYTFSNNIEK
jgi:hypothetical protein